MSTGADALNDIQSSGTGPRLANQGARTTGRNESKEPAPRDDISLDVKLWVLLPILFFHCFGFAVLLVLAGCFMQSEYETPVYFWPALVVGITGLPFAFAPNVKKLVDAIRMPS